MARGATLNSAIGSDRLIFVGGLHRSGTTPFTRILGQHPDLAVLADTGVYEDEGQHLQSVYKPANEYGGAGHFARASEAHLSESSPLVSAQTAQALLQSWQPYWDLSKPYLVEKSPPNLLMGRFLQALFPEATFLVVVRHPVTVALSTKKWTRALSRHPSRYASLTALVEHWVIAHRLLASDLPHLKRVAVVYYEDLIGQPEAELQRIQKFLQLTMPIPSDSVDARRNSTYQNWWEALKSAKRPGAWQRRRIEHRFADEIASYGYDLDDLNSRVPQSASARLRGSELP